MEPPSSPESLNLIIVAVCIVAVAVLSAAESSIIAVAKFRIRHLMEQGDTRARAVHKLLENHDRLFSAVILSGNLFTVLATSMGTAMAIRHLGPDVGIIVSTAVLTFLTVVFGELTPKTFAVTHAERVALFLARPLEVYVRLLMPLIWIFHASSSFLLMIFGVKDRPHSHFVTEDEIKAMIAIGGEEGSIEKEETKMLNRVFEFGDTEVSEVMVPRTEMVAIDSDATVADAMKMVSAHGYSRYPVIHDNLDDVRGMLYIKDILITMSQTSIETLRVSSFMREPFYVPENKMVTRLLDDMQKHKFHIAVVVDEYGGTAGVVTLEDIMEEIVGGLQDEFEEIEAALDVEIIDERTFIVTGQTGLDEINELAGTTLKSDDFNTIGGYVFGLFGRLPKVGEQVRSHELKFLIMEMDGKRITRVKITKQ